MAAVFSIRRRRILATAGGVAFLCSHVVLGQATVPSTPVFGTPTYAPAVGGYSGLAMPLQGVSDAGTAIGTVQQLDASGRRVGVSAVRWDGSGAAPVILGNLGVTYSAGPHSVAFAINRFGVAVGISERTDAFGNAMGTRAVRWNAGSAVATELENLGIAPSGYTASEATAVNAHGVAVGSAVYFEGGNAAGTRAVRWDPDGHATPLGILGVGTSGFGFAHAYAINDSGTVVGKVTRPGGRTTYPTEDFVAVRWDSGSADAVALGNLGTLPSGESFSEAFLVNAEGTAFGRALKIDATGNAKGFRAVRWDAGSTAATELGILGTDANGASQTTVRGANDLGAAVGAARRYGPNGEDLGTRPVRWDDDSATAMQLAVPTDGSTGVADGINNAGFMVGAIEPISGTGATLATLWRPDGSLIDLNSLIDTSTGWKLRRAYCISDTGWIAGEASFDPDLTSDDNPVYGRLFLVSVPFAAVPEPGGLVFVTAATCLATIRRRFRVEPGRASGTTGASGRTR